MFSLFRNKDEYMLYEILQSLPLFEKMSKCMENLETFHWKFFTMYIYLFISEKKQTLKPILPQSAFCYWDLWGCPIHWYMYLGRYKESAASQLMHQLLFINLLHLYNRHPLGIDKYHTKGGRVVCSVVINSWLKIMEKSAI